MIKKTLMERFLVTTEKIELSSAFPPSDGMSFGNKRTFISIKMLFINIYENRNFPLLLSDVLSTSTYLYLI
jgi:hypothetical protein